MSQPSVLYQLLEARLDGTLAEYVAEHRASTSWRTMATNLRDRTGVHINAETLRLWFADRIQSQTTITITDTSSAA